MSPSATRIVLITLSWLVAGVSASAAGGAQTRTVGGRTVLSLQEGWRFKQGAESGDKQGAGPGSKQGAAPGDVPSAAFDDATWSRVTVPHTWNRVGNEGIERSAETNTFRGPGWYRLRFAAPPGIRGRRSFLQFDGVGAVADVWLNGRYLGKHEGAFSRFRFETTAAIDPDGPNLLVVRADNSKPQPGSPTGHVIPLSGDFFMFGGLYRDVSLIVTDAVHVDMADFGGPGVYGRAIELSPAAATVAVAKRIVNDTGASRTVVVRTQIEDAAGHVVVSGEQRSKTAPGSTTVLESALRLVRPRLWRGMADPYLYRIVVTLRSPQGALLDEVAQPLGLRTMKFDANKGFFLNGERYRLVGASMHQDRPGKGWAISRADQAEDFDLLQEVGATAVRLAHYQHDSFSYDLADARGVVVWAEIPLVNEVSFDGSPADPALAANARQQLTELIRQNFNHPSIAVWSIANEIDLRATQKKGPGRAGALLQSLNALARQEDGGRPTTLADCCEQTPSISGNGGNSSGNAGQTSALQDRDALVGLTDTVGYNRYFGWYVGEPAQFGPYLDDAHARHPQLPMSISEYGGGSGLTQHTDNPLGGKINSHGRPHPEEVQTWYHEESWKQIRERDYLWAVFIWNMFDFAVDSRREGDLCDMNDKGLVTYDRGLRKDVFYFYKANWSEAPTLHLVGRRFIERAYGVVDVKAYSNAREAKLTVNGVDIGATACTGGVCVWPAVPLTPGLNSIAAIAERAGTALRDRIEWIYAGSASTVRIKAGDLAGLVMGNGERYGSDNFFIGGEGRGINPPDTAAADRVVVAGSEPVLYDSFRHGTFAYDIPLPNGAYTITANFVEPTESAAGKRMFDVLANGRVALSGLDIFTLAGGKLKAVDRSFEARVTDGRLRLEFRPKAGEAVVSALSITPASANEMAALPAR